MCSMRIKKTRRISFSEIAIFKDFKVGQLSISQVMIVSGLVFCSWFMSLPRFTSEKLTPLRYNSTVYAYSFFFLLKFDASLELLYIVKNFL